MDPLAPEYPWYTPYQFAGNKPIWAKDLDGLEEQIATGIWTEELFGGTYTEQPDGEYIYWRVLNGESQFYKSYTDEHGASRWGRISGGDDPRFHPQAHLRTEAGAGLSFNGVAGKDQWTEDMKNTFLGLLATAGGAPLIAAAFTEVVAMHANPLFVVNSSAAGFLGDGAVQYVSHKAGENSDKSFIKSYNFASGLANTFLKNPFAANFVGSYFNVSAISVTTAINERSFSPLKTNLETGLTGSLVGGTFGRFAGKVTGSAVWSSKLGSSFNESTVINAYGEEIVRKAPNILRLSLESALEITISSGTLISTETANSVTDEKK